MTLKHDLKLEQNSIFSDSIDFYFCKTRLRLFFSSFFSHFYTINFFLHFNSIRFTSSSTLYNNLLLAGLVSLCSTFIYLISMLPFLYSSYMLLYVVLLLFSLFNFFHNRLVVGSEIERKKKTKIRSLSLFLPFVTLRFFYDFRATIFLFMIFLL